MILGSGITESPARLERAPVGRAEGPLEVLICLQPFIPSAVGPIGAVARPLPTYGTLGALLGPDPSSAIARRD